jgi:hypothetical protein
MKRMLCRILESILYLFLPRPLSLFNGILQNVHIPELGTYENTIFYV